MYCLVSSFLRINAIKRVLWLKRALETHVEVLRLQGDQGWLTAAAASLLILHPVCLPLSLGQWMDQWVMDSVSLAQAPCSSPKTLGFLRNILLLLRRITTQLTRTHHTIKSIPFTWKEDYQCLRQEA